MEKQKGITKDTLKKLLQFEYVVLFLDEGGELASDNYVDISEDALINGEARYWLSEDLYSYFLSNAFDRDMNKLVNKLRQQ
jgi:hypothetical protein